MVMKWKITLPIIFVLALAGILFTTSQNKPVKPVIATGTVQYEYPTVERLLELTNAERIKAGVAPLVLDERLNMSAQAKADDMVVNNYYGHINPVTGVSGPTTITAECYYQSENINNNSVDSKRTVDSWMNSKPHKEAILDTKYETTGFGIKDGYTVQHFCDIN
jgi:uncharacterized protein YkwD